MRAQMLKISGHKNNADFYAEFPDEASFMKKHGKAFAKARLGTRIGKVSYGDKYNAIDLDINGAAQPVPQQGGGDGGEKEKKGSGVGQMIGTAKTAYSLYEGFKGGGASAAGNSSMVSGMMGMFKKNGGKIPKAQAGVSVGPQNDPALENYYDNNNPYFATQPGATTAPIAKPVSPMPQMPTGPQAVSSVGKSKSNVGAGAQGAPINPYEALPPVENKNAGWAKTMGKIDFLGISGKLIKGVGAINAERQQKKRAKQSRDLSALTLKAAQTTDVDADRMETNARTNQRELQLPVNTGEEFFPVYGTGKEVLAKNGRALKSSNFKKAQYGIAANGVAGGSTPWGMIGAAGSGIAGQATGNNAGGQVGGTIGKAIGSYWGPAGAAIGEIGGAVIGGLVDTNPKKTKKYMKQTQQNMQAETAIGMGEGIQKQYGAYVKNGGELKNYDENENNHGDALSGQLRTHWGGELATLSHNPYLPNDGETAMFVGDSHDDGGIGATYAGTSVEAEGGEPVVELPDSEGGNSAVVFGNLKINKDNAELLGDKNAVNKKFKTYVADLSKKEANSNKTIKKAITEFEDFTPITSFDKLKSNTLQLNVMGSNMKLKAIAHKKETAANLQSSINDTAAEYGLSAEHLAQGKYKKASKSELAEFGKRVEKAQVGVTVKPQYETELEQLELEPLAQKKETPSMVLTRQRLNGPSNTDVAPSNSQYNRELSYLEDGPITNPDATRYSDDTPDSYKKKGNMFSQDNISKAMTAYNEILPRIRKSDAEALDPQQLQGEEFALSHNQVEPVYAKGYNPQLDVPYDISLQEIRNENRASTRSAERMLGYNPAAAAGLASEAYAANQKVGAEEFRINQGRKDKTYSDNRAMENDAQLKNLGIYDQQYVRQSQAKSNTKAITQAAINSISDKFAKNKLENRKLQTYENLYNYRFDKDYRAVNENGLQQFDTHSKTPGDESRSEAERISDMEDELYDYKAKKRAERKAPKGRNGAIIQSLKRI
jgi:hypothetical protein